MQKLRENAEQELKEIEKKGLSATNIDNAYKLVEIMKGVDKIEMMQSGEYSRDGYSRDMEDYSRDGGGNYGGGNSRNRGYSRDGDYSNGEGSYDQGNSYRRGRNQRTGQYMHRPNYSRLSGDANMEEYRNRKMEYSNSRNEENKERMLEALDEFMCGLHGMMKQIFKDSDTREEREILQNWAQKIADL